MALTKYCALLLFLNFMNSAVGRDQPINGLSLGIVKVSPPVRVELSISNVSEKPLRIWEEWNEWGAAHWRVVIVRAGHVNVFFQNPDQQFSPNMPVYAELGPSKRITRVLNLSDGNWRGPDPKTFQFLPGDTVIVIYDVPKTYPAGDEFSVAASKMGVWYGVAAASATLPGGGVLTPSSTPRSSPNPR